MVPGSGEVPGAVVESFLYVGGRDRGRRIGTGPVVERDIWDTRPLRSIAIV